jgi:signal transduction histidine kinase
MKSTFISVVSHELKTPVALIKGYAGTLRRDDAEWDQETFQRGLAVIEEEADRLNELIDNLLMASKLQVEGMLHLDLADVALDRVIYEAAERFRIQSDRHTLTLDFPQDFPKVPGDAKRLRQVIENLISNAIKYSPNGGEIRLSGRYDENLAQVFVADQGIGIRPEEAERIFERFYRTGDSRTRSMPGAGLGLYLARAIIEAHGGRIWATANPDQKGTTFSFTLPRHHQTAETMNPETTTTEGNR